MKTEIFVMCDYGADNSGKLTLVGVFDTIFAKQMPVTHPYCTIIAKVRFEQEEAGKKTFTLSIADDSGIPVIPSAQLEADVKVPEAGYSSTSQIVATLSGLKFEKYGKHLVKLDENGNEIGSFPLYVRPLEK